MTDYSDPYNFNYATPIKPKGLVNNNRPQQTPGAPGFNVFNPYQGNNNFNRINLNDQNENKIDDLQGNIDLDKNAYAKTQYEDGEEIPILEELGICPINIKQKLISVLLFYKVDKKILEDSDMAGPLLIFIVFGLALVLQTKAHFGYIYGFSIFGSMIIFSLMNLMSKVKKNFKSIKEQILLYNTISVLGYCMVPIVLLSIIAIILQMNISAILASSYSATQFFEIVLSMREQKWLIFYPLVLFYTCFTLLAIF